MRHNIGLLGLLGGLLLIGWTIGFVVFGMHDGWYHVLVPVGLVLVLVQAVRRVDATD